MGGDGRLHPLVRPPSCESILVGLSYPIICEKDILLMGDESLQNKLGQAFSREQAKIAKAKRDAQAEKEARASRITKMHEANARLIEEQRIIPLLEEIAEPIPDFPAMVVAGRDIEYHEPGGGLEWGHTYHYAYAALFWPYEEVSLEHIIVPTGVAVIVLSEWEGKSLDIVPRPWNLSDWEHAKEKRPSTGVEGGTFLTRIQTMAHVPPGGLSLAHFYHHTIKKEDFSNGITSDIKRRILSKRIKPDPNLRKAIIDAVQRQHRILAHLLS